MACKTAQVEINSKLISVTQWDATTGLERLQSVLEVLKDSALPLILGEAVFSDFLRILSSCKESPAFIKDSILSAIVAVEGEEVTASNYDATVGVDLNTVFGTFALVMETNFKDFFVGGLNSMNLEEGNGSQTPPQQ
jgi:hypothetical protein